MNQTPAAILVLAASVCGYAAVSRPTQDSFAAMVGLAAIALAIWGVTSLVQAYQRADVLAGEQLKRLTTQIPDSEYATGGTSPIPVDALETVPDADDFQFSPEVRAQLSLVAHLQDKNRTQVIEEILRKHLPRFSNQRVA